MRLSLVDNTVFLLLDSWHFAANLWKTAERKKDYPSSTRSNVYRCHSSLASLVAMNVLLRLEAWRTLGTLSTLMTLLILKPVITKMTVRLCVCPLPILPNSLRSIILLSHNLPHHTNLHTYHHSLHHAHTNIIIFSFLRLLSFSAC